MVKRYGLHMALVGLVSLIGVIVNIHRNIHNNTMHNIYKLYIMHH